MTPSCPSCRNPGHPDTRFGKPFLRCAACGLRWAAEKPTDTKYETAYYDRGDGPLTPFVMLLHRVVSASAVRLAKRGNRVLEVGCGNGTFLRVLVGKDLEVHGLDLSPDALRLAAKRAPGARFHQGMLEAQHFPEGHFDAVWSFHVLEHVEDPAAFLAEIRRVIKPGGTFLVRVPDADSLEARLAGRAWFHFDWPFHLAHWNPSALASALSKAGFAPVRSDAAVEYLQVFLYSVLAALGVKRLGMKAKLLTLPLQLIFIPLNLILVLARRSGTMEFRAVKPKI